MARVDKLTPSGNSPEGIVVQEPTRRTVDIEALRGVCRSSISKALELAIRELDLVEMEVRVNDAKLRDAIARRQNKLGAKASLETQLSDTSVGFEPVALYLEGLMAAGKYTDFAFSGSTIKGTTSRIVVRNRYDLGVYEASVDVISLEVVFNLRESRQTGVPAGIIHPHIRKGKACWGNVQAEIPLIIQRGDYGVIFELIHDFLTSYNDVSPYAKISLFPRVRGQEDPPPPQVTIQEAASGEEGVTPPATGFFARIARSLPPQTSVASAPRVARVRPALQITPADPTAVSAMVVFSEAVDRDLRAQGIQPGRLTAHERDRMRRLANDTYGSAVYQRHLEYYVRWMRNGGARR